jgi:hypothetical protein
MFFLNGCGKSDHGEPQGMAKGEILGEPEMPISVPEEISQKEHYTIVEETTFKHFKRKLYIKLKEKVSEETLGQIAQELKNQDPQSYDRTFIFYHLPGMSKDQRAWAATHFNPNLEVEIFGLTKSREKAMKQTIKNPSRNIVGKWIWEGGGATIVIYKKNQKTYMEYGLSEESKIITEMVKSSSPLGQRYDDKEDNPHGEYVVIDSKGNLQMRNPKRTYAIAKKIT